MVYNKIMLGRYNVKMMVHSERNVVQHNVSPFVSDFQYGTHVTCTRHEKRKTFYSSPSTEVHLLTKEAKTNGFQRTKKWAVFRELMM